MHNEHMLSLVAKFADDMTGGKHGHEATATCNPILWQRCQHLTFDVVLIYPHKSCAAGRLLM